MQAKPQTRRVSTSKPKGPIDRTRDQGHRADGADGEEQAAGHEEQPPRAEEEHETEVPPAVAPGAKVGTAGASVAPQGDGKLGDAKAVEARLDDHLTGELHAAGRQPELEDGVAAESAQTAMEIPDVAVEEQAAEPAEHGVADDAVGPRHGVRLDAAQEPVAHDQVETLS